MQPVIPEGGIRDGGYISPIDRERIKRAVDAQLAAKGYRLVHPEGADLIVTYSIGSEEKLRVTQSPSGGVYYPGYGYGGWYGGTSTQVSSYTEGTLAVEFYDARTQQAVWVGWASKRMSKSDDNQEVIQEAVARIMQPFPSKLPPGEGTQTSSPSGPRPPSAKPGEKSLDRVDSRRGA